MKAKTRRPVAKCAACGVVFLNVATYLDATTHRCVVDRHPAAHRPTTTRPNPTTPVA